MKSTHSLTLAIGTAFALGMAASNVSAQTGNPFSVTEAAPGHLQLAAMKDGKCGTGKCGANMKKSAKPMKDGKCGANMKDTKPMKDGKCGANMKDTKPMKDGKCGAGMKNSQPMKEGKCGTGMKQ